MSYMLLNSYRYSKNIDELHNQINTINTINNEINVLLDSTDCIIDSLQFELDSISSRYQMFDSKPARDMVDIINAIIQVESSGNENAYNSKEDAVGVLQIRRCMVDDVNRILARMGSSETYSYSDRWNRHLSIEMFDIFCTYYGLNTAEEMARCWNGGPRGINNPYTIGYWNKVEEVLVSNE